MTEEPFLVSTYIVCRAALTTVAERAQEVTIEAQLIHYVASLQGWLDPAKDAQRHRRAPPGPISGTTKEPTTQAIGSGGSQLTTKTSPPRPPVNRLKTTTNLEPQATFFSIFSHFYIILAAPARCTTEEGNLSCYQVVWRATNTCKREAVVFLPIDQGKLEF